MRYATVSYPGIADVLQGSATVVSGVQPSVCTLQVAPEHLQAVTNGDLIIRWFDPSGNRTIVWQDAAVVRLNARSSRSGNFYDLTIADRRWRWSYLLEPGDFMSARYNVRKPDGSIIESTRKSLRQLGSIVLSVMGEVGFFVDDLPTDYFPEVVWDRITPAAALQGLAQAGGCLVVLNYTNNQVQVVRQNVGATLPGVETGRLMNPGINVSNGNYPKGQTVVCAPTRWQWFFALEPVALDVDDQIKTYDQVSYLDVNNLPELSMQEVLASAGQEAYQYAQRSVYKMYRITGPIGQPLPDVVPGPRDRLQPIGTLLETDSENKPLPARAYGTFLSEGGRGAPQVGFWPDNVSVSGRIVTFGGQAAQYINGKTAPAIMYVETAAEVRTSLGASYREDASFNLQAVQDGAGYRLLQNDELRRTYRAQWTFGGERPTYQSTVDNGIELLLEMSNHAKNKEAEIVPRTGGDATYEGILPIELDGAIRQVSYTFGGSQAATTRASLNYEFTSSLPNARERIEAVNERENRALKALDPREGKKSPEFLQYPYK